MIIHHVIYLFSSVERAVLQLQLSKPNAGFSFLVGRGSSNTKVFRSSSDIRQQLLPSRFRWGSALPLEAAFYRQKRRSSAEIRFRRRRRTVVWNNQESVLLPAAIGGRRSSSAFIRSSVLEEIEGQGQVYLLAIEGTIVHWRSL